MRYKSVLLGLFVFGSFFVSSSLLIAQGGKGDNGGEENPGEGSEAAQDESFGSPSIGLPDGASDTEELPGGGYDSEDGKKKSEALSSSNMERMTRFARSQRTVPSVMDARTGIANMSINPDRPGDLPSDTSVLSIEDTGIGKTDFDVESEVESPAEDVNIVGDVLGGFRSLFNTLSGRDDFGEAAFGVKQAFSFSGAWGASGQTSMHRNRRDSRKAMTIVGLSADSDLGEIAGKKGGSFPAYRSVAASGDIAWTMQTVGPKAQSNLPEGSVQETEVLSPDKGKQQFSGPSTEDGKDAVGEMMNPFFGEEDGMFTGGGGEGEGGGIGSTIGSIGQAVGGIIGAGEKLTGTLTTSFNFNVSSFGDNTVKDNARMVGNTFNTASFEATAKLGGGGGGGEGEGGGGAAEGTASNTLNVARNPYMGVDYVSAGLANPITGGKRVVAEANGFSRAPEMFEQKQIGGIEDTEISTLDSQHLSPDNDTINVQTLIEKNTDVMKSTRGMSRIKRSFRKSDKKGNDGEDGGGDDGGGDA